MVARKRWFAIAQYSTVFGRSTAYDVVNSTGLSPIMDGTVTNTKISPIRIIKPTSRDDVLPGSHKGSGTWALAPKARKPGEEAVAQVIKLALKT